MILDFGSGCCVEVIVIFLFSVVMIVLKVDVILSWLLKVDNIIFCRLRILFFLNCMVFVCFFYKISLMCLVLFVRKMFFFDLLLGYVLIEIEFLMFVIFVFRLINLIFLVFFLRIWEMLKVWFVILSCDVVVEILVLLLSSSFREFELLNVFFILNDLRLYVIFVLKLENRFVLK